MEILPLVTAMLLVSSAIVNAEPSEIRLWSAQAPGALGANAKDIPSLTPFSSDPDKADGRGNGHLPWWGLR